MSKDKRKYYKNRRSAEIITTYMKRNYWLLLKKITSPMDFYHPIWISILSLYGGHFSCSLWTDPHICIKYLTVPSKWSFSSFEDDIIICFKGNAMFCSDSILSLDNFQQTIDYFWKINLCWTFITQYGSLFYPSMADNSLFHVNTIPTYVLNN